MKRKRVILFFVLLITIILSFVTTCYGFELRELTGTQTETEALQKAGNSIVKVITTIGVVVSVIMLIVLGIKYMMGSTSEKAEYKKTLLPYIIGAGLVFAASGIAQLIYELAIQL